MAGEGLRADDLRTVELDDALEGAAPSRWGSWLSVHAQWRLGLWLMSAAGFFAWVATGAPWMLARVLPFVAASEPIPIQGGDPALSDLAQFVHSHGFPTAGLALLFTGAEMYGAIGLLIGGALFMSLRPRVRATLLLVYAAWLATQGAQAFFASTLMASGSFAAPWLGMSPDLRIVTMSPGLGLWLTWLAALLGIAGVILARQALRQGALDAPGASGMMGDWRQALAARPRAERWGVGLATTGLVLWFCGFFALPWLTQGCTGLHVSFTHFLSGSCAGLDSADTLAQSPFWKLFLPSASAGGSAGLGSDARFTAQALASPGFFVVLATALAGWALLALWGDQGGARRYGWVVAWLVFACVVAAMAFAGAQDMQANPIILAFNNTGPWMYGPGLAVTLAGLAVAGGGLACALSATLRDRIGDAAQASLSSSSSSSSSRPSPTARSVGEKM